MLAGEGRNGTDAHTRRRMDGAHMRTPGRRPLLKKDLNAGLRAAQALELRITGMSQQQIADQLGVNQSSVSRMITKALKQHKAEGVDDLRKIDSQRMEQLHQIAWRYAEKGDMQAAGVITRLLDRRARLFGLDAAGANGEGVQVHYSVSALVFTAEDARLVLAERLAQRPDPQTVYDQVADLPPWSTADDIARHVSETARGIIPQQQRGDTVYMKTIIVCRDRPPDPTTHGAPAALAQPIDSDDDYDWVAS
jgi:predicted transcriptional regulator